VPSCPDEAQVVAYSRGLLTPEGAQALEEHLDGCARCCELVALSGRESIPPRPEPQRGEVEDSSPERPAKLAELAPGAVLGRYAILEVIGKGAMGTVYAAYDRELDRRVALKLLRPEVPGGEDARELRERLLREARTMAQLSHPNVVAVHDVGTFEGTAFVAMDFVHGRTLRQWLLASPRTWREILRVFLDAGRGLAAAHARGIVHRDFKADNVLVDVDGRVFVADFGLARGTRDVAASEAEAPPSPAQVASEPAFQPKMTVTGAILGTPAYMAPEQYEGSASPRSDLFAFGVALYEALYGQHPFPTETLPGLRDAIRLKRLRAPPQGIRIPRFLSRAVMRALEPDPDARWPTMDAFLSALSADPRRRMRLVAAPVAAALACLAAILGTFAVREDPAVRCQFGERRLAGVWDGEGARAMRAAFARTGLAYAQESAGIVERTMNAYAQKWAGAHREACEATHVRGEQSSDLLDRRMQCLEDRLRELGALAGTLARADARTVENATRVAAALRDVGECAHHRRLLARVAPPDDPKTGAEVQAVRAGLARIRALEATGHYGEGLALAQAAVKRAQDLGYRPLVAEALYRLGRLQRARSDNQAAVSTLHAAEVAASTARHDEVGLRARLAIVEPLSRMGLRDEALRAVEHVLARIEGTRGDSMLRADALVEQAKVHQEVAHDQKAEVSLRQAIALITESASDRQDRLAVALWHLSTVLMNSGRHEEAVLLAERAAVLSERAHGSQHPATASIVAQLGAARVIEGRLAKGEADLRRALAIQERVLGPHHWNTLATRENLGAALFRHGRYAEAVRNLDLAVEIRRRRGPHSSDAFLARMTRAWAIAKLGRLEEARREAGTLRAWAKRSFGRDKLLHGLALGLAGYLLERTRRFTEALELTRRAISIITRADDLDELLVVRLAEERVLRKLGRAREALRAGAETLAFFERRLGFGVYAAKCALELGKTRLVLGDPAGAREVLERAVSLFDSRREDVALVLRADAKLTLAEALAKAGRDERRLRTLVREARSHLAEAPHKDAELQAVASRLIRRVDR
jgi:tetratricopeptide (TPR) repeat protein/tRNA A-37 threonylcarbamoyl transferase component Bud32